MIKIRVKLYYNDALFPGEVIKDFEMLYSLQCVAINNKGTKVSLKNSYIDFRKHNCEWSL